MKSYKLRTVIYLSWIATASVAIMLSGKPLLWIVPIVCAVPYAIDNVIAKVKERKVK